MIEIPLTQEQTALISEEDADLARFKWHAHLNPHYSGGGAYVALRNKTLNSEGKRGVEYMHRTVIARVLGRKLARTELVDHIDGNSLNNTRDNLRLTNNAGNLSNRGKQANNTSGFKGVVKHNDKWVAQISRRGMYKYLGIFASSEEAAQAYDAAANELHGEFARLNFPKP